MLSFNRHLLKCFTKKKNFHLYYQIQLLFSPFLYNQSNESFETSNNENKSCNQLRLILNRTSHSKSIRHAHFNSRAFIQKSFMCCLLKFRMYYYSRNSFANFEIGYLFSNPLHRNDCLYHYRTKKIRENEKEIN